MGLRGPAPKPTVLVKLEGNPGHRTANNFEPQFNRGAPNCPSHLSKTAKKVWKQIVPQLLAVDLMTMAFEGVVANYCQAYANIQDDQRIVNQSSRLVKTPSGYLMENPLATMIRSNTEIVTKLGRELGLSPSSSSRIRAGSEQSGIGAPNLRAVNSLEDDLCA